MVEVIFILDCHDREIVAFIAESRAIDGAEVRRLIRKAVFARFGKRP